jgi:Gluconate 2-dehydrogenase subunit 3
MNRRGTLKTLMAISGGLIALPAWAEGWSAQEMTAHHSSFSLVEQDVLASVADTIIPSDGTIGALSVGTDKFLQKLFDNCYEKEVQDNVKAQLTGLETAAQKAFGKSFVNCDQAQRQQLIEKLGVSENKNEKGFFTLIKSETIRGFNTSREVMVNYLNYKVVPGHYYGCVDVKA